MRRITQATEKDYRNYRLESELIVAIRARLAGLGAKVLKVHGDAFQERAVDLIVCYSGRYLAVEAKVGKNQATEHQRQFLQDVEIAGGIGIVAWTVADCLEAVQQIDRERATHDIS